MAAFDGDVSIDEVEVSALLLLILHAFGGVPDVCGVVPEVDLENVESSKAGGDLVVC